VEANVIDIYWPGTKIVKSRGNAFDWRNLKGSAVLGDRELKLSEIAKKNAGNNDLAKSRKFVVHGRAKKLADTPESPF
jgi:hypothetical protein